MASDPIVWAIIGAPAGLIFFISGFTKWSHYNTIKNTPTSKVEAVAAGFAEVYGEAIPKDDYIKSPFSGRDCAFYTYTVEQNSGNKGSWVIINKGCSDAPFFIKDETGKIEVDPRNAELEVENKETFSVAGGEQTPWQIKQFLSGVNVPEKTPCLSLGPIHTFYSRRYTECIIEKGESAFVTGTAMPKDDVMSERHEDTLLIKKGDLNKFFLISDKAEKWVLGEMEKEAVLRIVGGGLVALLGLAYIFFRMNML